MSVDRKKRYILVIEFPCLFLYLFFFSLRTVNENENENEEGIVGDYYD